MNPQLIQTTDPLDFIMIPADDENKPFKIRLGNPLFDDAASSIGKKIKDIGGKYDTFINSLFSSQYRFYFDVDNQYIIRKLSLLHAPIIYRGDWTLNDETQNISKTKNVHACDLYLPLMGLITLVLFHCLKIGISNATLFTPIIMINQYWKCLLVSFIELIITRILFYLFGNLKVSNFDLISTLNYRYCSLCILFIFNLITFHIFSVIGTIYIVLSQAIFVYKSLQMCIEQQIQNNYEFDINLEPTLAFLISFLQITCSCVLLYIL